MNPSRIAALLLPPLLALASPVAAQDVAPITSWQVTVRGRTLRGCPLKHVITSAAGWDRVTADLAGAPPRPAFDGPGGARVVLLVVADITGGATSELDPALRLLPDGSLRARLHRREPDRGVDASGDPALQAFFVLLPAFAGGIRLDHRTKLEDGGGFVERPALPEPADRDAARLPELGPDLLFTYAMADGSAPPARVLLRTESYFTRADLPARLRTIELPLAGLGTGFPRIGKDEVRHVFAAHTDTLRSANPFVLRALPADGPDGSPPRLRHCFSLEAAVERQR